MAHNLDLTDNITERLSMFVEVMGKYCGEIPSGHDSS